MKPQKFSYILLLMLFTFCQISFAQVKINAKSSIDQNIPPGLSDEQITNLLNPPPGGGCTALPINVTCNGANDGSAMAVPSSGIPPYTYLWSTGATTQTINNLPGGFYTVTITDNDSIPLVETCVAFIDEPDSLVCNTIVSNETCINSLTGSATVSVTGGVAPYTYLWNTGGTGNMISGIGAGSYYVVVTDNNGCFDTCFVSVTTISQLAVTCMVDSNITVPGGSDGVVSVNASAGIIPYAYSWSTGGNTAQIGGLGAGTYTAFVTDSLGCMDSCTVTLIDPNQPLNCSVIVQDVLCNGALTGSATVTASGGAPPYNYLWNTGATSQMIDSLAAGSYMAYVIDSNQDTSTCQAVISEPAPIVLAFTDSVYPNDTTKIAIDTLPHGTHLTTQIPGVTVSASANGGRPDKVVIFNSDLSGTLDPDLEVNLGNLLILPVDDVDANGDGLIDNPNDNEFGGTMIFEFANPTDIHSFVFVDQDDGSPSSAMALDASGNIITTVSIPDLGNGSVQTVIMNAIGVSRLEIDLVSSGAVTCLITELPDSVDIADIYLQASGGTPGYTYLWSNGATTQNLTGVQAGTYSVTVTDSAGCEVNGSHSIQIPLAAKTTWRDGIVLLNRPIEVNVYPNPSFDYFHIEVYTDNTKAITMRLFDSLGRLLIDERIDNESLHHQLDLSSVQPGIYICNVYVGGELHHFKLIRQ